MATLARRGAGTPATTGTTWANLTNAVDGTAGTNPATYATMTNATSGAVATIEVTGYAFSDTVAAVDTLNTVTVALRHFENNTGRFASVRFQPYDGATAIGSIFTATMATGARTDSTTFPVTLAQIRSSTFKIRVTITGAASTQSRVFSIDQVDVTADYTPAPPAITQAAYRFYADGTESGSTALDAQDTAPTVDTSAGDVNVGLRVRLQSTSAIAPPAASDFQLQWEKNTSGTWADVVAPTGISATHPDSARDSAQTINLTIGTAKGQSFLGDGRKLSKAGFRIWQTGSPTAGTLTAVLYAHTGTFGTGGIPTGAILATSTTSIEVTSLPTTIAWQYFDFDETFTLTAGTPYFIVLRSVGMSATGSVAIGTDNTAPTHSGNEANLTGTWDSLIEDLIFEVYTAPATPGTTVVPYVSANLTDGAATTNRLGAGSGSFAAGKVSEDGLVDDLGWTANNHTEVLYSVTLKQADLAPTDTLRFRVLLNGATTAMTYTAVPTVTIATAGPATINGVAAATVALNAIAVGTVVAEVIDATATATVALEVTATGTVSAPGAIVTGVASATVSLTAVAAGTVVAEIVTGVAAATVAVTAQAAGQVIAEIVGGVAAVGLAVTAGATGIRVVNATATVAVSLSAVAAGSVVGAPVVTGVAAGTVTVAVAAVGVRVVAGAASASAAVAATATGRRVVNATAQTSVTFTTVAAGTRFGVVAGTATGSVAVSAVGVGTIGGITVGTATAQIAVTVAAVGQVVAEVVSGVAVVPVAVSAAATGTRSAVVAGAAAVNLSVAAAATGTRLHHATASSSLALSATAVGQTAPVVTATAAATVAVMVAAVGSGAIRGWWQGAEFDAMQWGDQPVVEWVLTP